MRHVAVTVSDVHRSADFYRNAFGMRPFGLGGPDDRFAPLVSPGLRDQVSISSVDAPTETPSSEPAGVGSVDHFGFVVSPRTSLDAVRTHLEDWGATFESEVDVDPRVPSMFFRDPDGALFQVTRFPRFTKLYVLALPALRRWRQRRPSRAGAGEHA